MTEAFSSPERRRWHVVSRRVPLRGRTATAWFRRSRPFAVHRRPAGVAGVVVEHPGPRFTVTVEPVLRRLVVAGEFDLAAVGQFTTAAASLAHDHRRDVAVDLGGVEFVDAAGLGALVAVRNVVVDRGEHLRVHRAGPGIRRLMLIAGLELLLATDAEGELS